MPSPDERCSPPADEPRSGGGHLAGRGGHPASGDRSKFRCTELYKMIRKLQPHSLIP
jgi:hypothetical protein